MQKIVFILMMITLSFGMDNSNLVTTVDACKEFKNNAAQYYEKATKDKFYEDRYLKIGEYFEQMYKECLRETSQLKSYPGYRSNIIQQQQQK